MDLVVAQHGFIAGQGLHVSDRHVLGPVARGVDGVVGVALGIEAGVGAHRRLEGRFLRMGHQARKLHGHQSWKTVGHVQAQKMAVEIIAAHRVGGQKQRLQAADHVQVVNQGLLEALRAVRRSSVEAVIRLALDHFGGVLPSQQTQANAHHQRDQRQPFPAV